MMLLISQDRLDIARGTLSAQATCHVVNLCQLTLDCNAELSIRLGYSGCPHMTLGCCALFWQ